MVGRAFLLHRNLGAWFLCVSVIKVSSLGYLELCDIGPPRYQVDSFVEREVREVCSSSLGEG